MSELYQLPERRGATLNIGELRGFVDALRFSGFKISSTLCVVGTIVGEFVASDRGLGYLLKDSQAMIDTPPMFASLILISLFGLALFGGVSALSRIAMPWQSEGPA